MREAVIVAAVRSPIGRYGGALARMRPDDLLAAVLRALVDRVGLDPALIGEVYAGCGNQAGEDNRDVARMAALLAEFPVTVPGITLNRNCASALDAVNEAARAIKLGECDVAIGSGVESMSRAPWSVPKPASVPTMAGPTMYDTTVGWRYPNPRLDDLYPIVSLGQTAEAIADDLGITREQQDAFAIESQTRAIAAINGGRFDDEIAAIDTTDTRGNAMTVARDEHPRARLEGDRLTLTTDLDALATLSASFREGGTVTAGNSCGLNDGAAAVLLMSADKAAALGLEPLARWVGAASAGVDPGVMGYGPVPADRKAVRAARTHDRRHRPDRDQRGLRGADARLHDQARPRSRNHERQRRRDRARPSDRLLRRAHSRDARPRAPPPCRLVRPAAARPRDAVRRRRHGCQHDRRDGLDRRGQ